MKLTKRRLVEAARLLSEERAKDNATSAARFKTYLAEYRAEEQRQKEQNPVFASGPEPPKINISVETDVREQQVFADPPKDKPYFVKPGDSLADAAKKYYENETEIPPRDSEHRRPRPEKK